MSARSAAAGLTAAFAAATTLGLLVTTSPAAVQLAAAVGEPAKTPLDGRQSRRLALLIGIGDYRHFEPKGRAGQTDLEAPPRDVERMRLTLRRFGFEGEENVRVLIDQEASKEGIAGGFRWLAERATDSADVVLIYYSGHGTYTTDLDGDEATVTEGDEHDEALVPWDATRGSDPSPLVLDDEIRGWLDELATENVTLIIDACYSGTVSRGGPMEVNQVARPRGPIGNSGAGGSLNPLSRPSHALLTAAGSGEQAWEMKLGDDQKAFGIFTYHLTRALDGAGPHARYDELMYDLRRRVQTDADRAQPWDVMQTPQLEGDGSARLFRVGADVARRPFVLVEGARGDGRYSIDAGAVHGVRVGAVYDVFLPEEMEFAGRPAGHIRVDSVAETHAFGNPLVDPGAPPGPVGAFPAGSRAVLARVPVGAATLDRLAVHVEAGAEDAAEAIENLAFIQLTDAVSAHVRIRQRGDVAQVVMDHVVLPPLSEDDAGSRRSIVDGEEVVGFAPTTEALCAPLSRAFAIASFERIQNPAPPFELVLGLDLVEKGRPPPAAPPSGHDSRTDTTYVGRDYDLYAWVGPAAGHDLGGGQFYLTVAFEGYVSEPSVLYPPGRDRGMPQPVELGRWIPVVAGRNWIHMAPPAGPEIIKAVANSDQYDFRSLVDRVRILCRSVAQRGGVGRGEDEEPAVPVLGWKTLDHAVLILSERQPEATSN